MNKKFFVGIGVQKCASTWLYDILRDHPEVALSDRKEIDFFSHNFGSGYQWYENQFPEDAREKVLGEISPSYFVDANVPERLLAYAPDAKVIVSLRDPVERAISNHRHEVRIGNFFGSDLSFEAGLRNNPLYVEQSRYGKHLKRWLGHLPASRLMIVFQEDIETNPGRVAKNVYRFLEVDPDHVSSAVDGRSNESHVYRFHVLEHMRRAARGAIRTLGIEGVWRAGQRAGLQKLYRRLNRRPPSLRIPPVSGETRTSLCKLLESDIRMVEEITGRKLPQWRSDQLAGRDADATRAELYPAVNA